VRERRRARGGPRGEGTVAYENLLTRCAVEARDAVEKRTAETTPAQAAEARTKLVDAARRLRDAGFEEDSRKQLKALVEAGGTVPADLREPDATLGWWKDWTARLGPELRTGGELLLVILLLAALLRVLVFRLRLVAGEGVSAAVVAALQDEAARLKARGVLSDRYGKELDQVAVWESDFGGVGTGEEDGRRQRLVLPIAIWLGFNEQLEEAPAPALGTTYWRSYALFVLGAVSHRAGKAATASGRSALRLRRRHRGGRQDARPQRAA
jgi:hypothetical protein